MNIHMNLNESGIPEYPKYSQKNFQDSCTVYVKVQRWQIGWLTNHQSAKVIKLVSDDAGPDSIGLDW